MSSDAGGGWTTTASASAERTAPKSRAACARAPAERSHFQGPVPVSSGLDYSDAARSPCSSSTEEKEGDATNHDMQGERAITERERKMEMKKTRTFFKAKTFRKLDGKMVDARARDKTVKTAK